jgi:ABC-type multidrug transport system fused ATPase/permease subunit
MKLNATELDELTISCLRICSSPLNQPNSSDAITGNRDIFFFMISVPLGLAISLTYLYVLLGWSALVGFFCMAVTFPLPTLLYMRYAKLQQGVMKRTDERIGVVGELLNSVRVVKYFGWERAMMNRIDEKRDAEQKMIWKRTVHIK